MTVYRFPRTPSPERHVPRRPLRPIAVPLVAALLAACASGGATAPPASTAPAAALLGVEQKQAEARAIYAAGRRFSTATDPAERAALFTEGAWVLWEGPDGRERMIIGAKSILEFLAAAPEEFARVRSGLMRVADAGDQAYEYGTILQDHAAAEPARRGPLVGYFSRTWRKVDGDWKIDTEIVRRAASAPAVPSP